MLLQIIKIVRGCLDCENQMVFEDLSDVLRRRSVGSSSAFCHGAVRSRRPVMLVPSLNLGAVQKNIADWASPLAFNQSSSSWIGKEVRGCAHQNRIIAR